MSNGIYDNCVKKYYKDDGITQLQCKLANINDLPRITFVLGLEDFSFEGKELVNNCTSPTPFLPFYTCSMLFQFSNNAFKIVFGQAFMLKYFTAYYIEKGLILIGSYKNGPMKNNENNVPIQKGIPESNMVDMKSLTLELDALSSTYIKYFYILGIGMLIALL